MWGEQSTSGYCPKLSTVHHLLGLHIHPQWDELSVPDTKSGKVFLGEPSCHQSSQLLWFAAASSPVVMVTRQSFDCVWPVSQLSHTMYFLSTTLLARQELSMFYFHCSFFSMRLVLRSQEPRTSLGSKWGSWRSKGQRRRSWSSHRQEEEGGKVCGSLLEIGGGAKLEMSMEYTCAWPWQGLQGTGCLQHISGATTTSTMRQFINMLFLRARAIAQR